MAGGARLGCPGGGGECARLVEAEPGRGGLRWASPGECGRSWRESKREREKERETGDFFPSLEEGEGRF